MAEQVRHGPITPLTSWSVLRTHNTKLRAQVCARGSRALTVPWPRCVRSAPSPAAPESTGL
eukprot:1400117-Prymnesium_polylepis.1